MYVNRRNFRALQEIGVEEHDGDVRFQTGSGNMAVSCMRNASGHNYRNSSFIMELAMGQITRSRRTYFYLSLPAVVWALGQPLLALTQWHWHCACQYDGSGMCSVPTHCVYTLHVNVHDADVSQYCVKMHKMRWHPLSDGPSASMSTHQLSIQLFIWRTFRTLAINVLSPSRIHELNWS